MRKESLHRAVLLGVLAGGLAAAAWAEPEPDAVVAPMGSPPPAAEPHPLLRSAAQDLEQGHWRHARNKAKKVLSENKKSSEAWVVLGRACAGMGKHKKALRRFKKALKYDAHNAAAYYWKGQSFEKIGKLDEAANEYQAAFRADPAMETARKAWTRIRDRVIVTE